VRKGLGEVAHQAPVARVDLLGEQPDVVGVAGDALEDLAGSR